MITKYTKTKKRKCYIEISGSKARSTGDIHSILLILGHPLLGTSENHSSSLSISLRHLTESGTRLC